MVADDFYRYESGGVPTAGEAKNAILALAVRAGRSIAYSVAYMPAELAHAFWALMTPSSLWAFCVVLACYFLSLVLTGPIAAAISALLVLYGIYSFVKDIRELMTKLADFSSAVYSAKDDTDLRTAGKLFAECLTEGLFAAIQLLFTSRAFRLVEKLILRRLKPPAVIEESVKQAKKQAEMKRQAEEADQKNRPKPSDSATAENRPRSEGRLPTIARIATAGAASSNMGGDSTPLYVYAGGAVLALTALAVGAAATRRAQ